MDIQKWSDTRQAWVAARFRSNISGGWVEAWNWKDAVSMASKFGWRVIMANDAGLVVREFVAGSRMRCQQPVSSGHSGHSAHPH